MDHSDGRSRQAYVLKNIDFLLAKGIRPYAVFDGARPPLKASRRGPTNRTHEDAVQTIIVSPLFRGWAALMRAPQGLRARKVPYLVAPMEADSQLVHLEQIGITSATLTLDHDLVILGSQKVRRSFRLPTRRSSPKRCCSSTPRRP